MAHIESLAVGGYYATPPSLIPAIASRLSLEMDDQYAFLDPCAGEGAAMLALMSELYGRVYGPELVKDGKLSSIPAKVRGYFVEMEERRYQILWDRVHSVLGYGAQSVIHHADAFEMEFTKGKSSQGQAADQGVSLLWLNPPYDLDKEFGRLEERFLRRFTSTLLTEGVLVYIVPFYALAHSAETLARHYGSAVCFKFPVGEWEAYKQVVVYARKRATPLVDPDPTLLAKVQRWAKMPEVIPELTMAAKPLGALPRQPTALRSERSHQSTPVKLSVGFDRVREVPFDLATVRERYRAWSSTTRGGTFAPIRSVLPDPTVDSLATRTYPMAVAPKPAHIAAGIAAGVFNGERVTADDPTSGAPDLLVKGVFDREFRTVEEKTNKDGDVTGVVQVQQPKLVVTVLDLSTHKLHEVTPSVETTGTVDPAKMTTGDLLTLYGKALLQILKAHCPVRYDATDPAAQFPLPTLKRPLYPAQAHAVRAAVTLLGGPGLACRRRTGLAAVILGEIGCLRGDTPIHDPLTGETVTVAERHRRAEPFHVSAMGPRGPVVAAAMPPVKYAPAQMLRVVLADGSKIVVTPAHRFWTGSEWITASTVAERIHGGVPVLLASSSADDLSTPARGGTRWSRTTPGFQADYQRGPSSCGERPLADSDSDRGAVPSRGDAPARTPQSSREDDSAPEAGRSRPCPGSDLPSMTRFAIREGGPLREPSPPRLESRPRTARDSSAARSQSPEGSSPRPHTSSELSLVALPSTPRASSSPSGRYNWQCNREGEEVQHRAVVAVESVGVEPYFDFHVPVFNNYWAVGLWHHNCGKTGVAITTALASGARKVLVMCPPHLLQGWADQLRAVYPAASVHVLQTVADVQAFEALDSHEIAFALLSREVAKLGHGWVSIPAAGEKIGCVCPRCGVEVPEGDHARRRSRCAARAFTPEDGYARLLCDLGAALLRFAPRNPHIVQTLRGRTLLRAQRRYSRAEVEAASPEAAQAAARREYFRFRETPAATNAAWTFASLLLDRTGYDDSDLQATLHYLAGLDRPELTAEIAERLYTAAAMFQPGGYGAGARIRRAAVQMLLLLPPGCELQQAVAARLREFVVDRESVFSGGGSGTTWSAFAAKVKSLKSGEKNPNGHWYEIVPVDQTLAYRSLPLGASEHLVRALEGLWGLGSWKLGDACGEPLFQAVGEPMRYPLATYISRFCPQTFDFLILDEGHEYSTDGSAQERAAHRLTGLRIPTLLLTGSIMNGYAESLFANWWALFPSFRREFSRDQRGRYVERYGYRKRLLQDVDKKSGEVVAYGSMSDRVEHREKDLGNAPGVLPLFVLQMLADCVTLHKADLAQNLPPCREIPVPVALDTDQSAEHMRLFRALMQQVKADRFSPLAGKLWGQVSEIPSHLDRCTVDTGNTPEGRYDIAYPPSEGSRLVASGRPFAATKILPKEEQLLDLIARERAEGRNVMVLTWHVELLPRLAKLIQARFGWKVPVLDPAKVPTQKRQAWIDKHVVAVDAPVLLTNPVCVQTGLNNLVHFATQWWHENPACNPIVFRQTKGRSDRLGQDQETRIYFPVYEIASQRKAHSLLLHKVGVSMATDGLDAESALQAAGVGETTFSGFSVGKELYKLLEESGR